MYLTIYEVIYVSEMQETKRWHFSKTDNFYAYCYVYLLWHHLTSVIKRLQLKRGPIWMHLFIFLLQVAFWNSIKIWLMWHHCRVFFFLLSILKEIVKWVVNTMKSAHRIADTPLRSKQGFYIHQHCQNYVDYSQNH